MQRGPNRRLAELLQEVDEVERTMRMLQAELITHDGPSPTPDANGHHRPMPQPQSNGNGTGGGDISTLEDDGPAFAAGSPPASRTPIAAFLGLTVLIGAGLTYLLAGPSWAAPSLSRARLSAFDIGVLALVCVNAYLIALALIGREPRKRFVVSARGRPFFVIAVPAARASAGLQRTIQRLLESRYERYLVVVVDRGEGEAGQAALLAAGGDPRVIVESLSGARRADALNHAFGLACGLLDRRDPRLDGVSAAGLIFSIVQPGGWLEPEALRIVSRQFDRQHCAATQIHVRILESGRTTAAAIEGLESAAFHVIAQTARNRTATAQLRDIGAFFRLGALRKLSEQPWSAAADDELEIALRLIENGHRIRSCRDTCAYREAASSLGSLAHRRRLRARGIRGAWPHISRLWEARRISLATRTSMTLQLLIPAPFLAPAIPLACLLALVLALLPADHGLTAAIVHGGIGVRGVVLALILAPLAALCWAYIGTSGARRRRVGEAPEVQGISAWALPGVAVALLAHGVLRLFPGRPARPGWIPGQNPPARETPTMLPTELVSAQPAWLAAPSPQAAPPVPQIVPGVPAHASSHPPTPWNFRDAETIQAWVQTG
jgi:hypothetical protein